MLTPTPVACPGCGAEFALPELDPEEGAEIVALVVRYQKIQAIYRIREATGASLPDAKATLYHLVLARGCCHWCGGAIPSVRHTLCPGCGRLNIDPTLPA